MLNWFQHEKKSFITSGPGTSNSTFTPSSLAVGFTTDRFKAAVLVLFVPRVALWLFTACFFPSCFDLFVVLLLCLLDPVLHCDHHFEEEWFGYFAYLGFVACVLSVVVCFFFLLMSLVGYILWLGVFGRLCSVSLCIWYAMLCVLVSLVGYIMCRCIW